uniref:Cell cycle checkpoint protein RAD17 isoform X2 n=1 Tax=Petromyzon marinus TaxID=7757 RepID=A0AAJ7TZ07_PETMA|nr:cell cycle checkpoint protein RAD17 isoform X2 [Petromyzon marinus]XP_032826672.1 cell cycle checkpoint protein RAD17 isoform X2 [Petromyzon marinus]XP_032826674.1 cell cycle checkpoint protein RAD17 isoform X2 [Petromyzon marinus]
MIPGTMQQPSKRKMDPPWVQSSFEGIGGDLSKASGCRNTISSLRPHIPVASKVKSRRGAAAAASCASMAKTGWRQDYNRDSAESWVERHAPTTTMELAVHKKKVEEVETWLRAHALQYNARKGSILLITGPAGAGKTATLQVLCKQLGIIIHEWINPLEIGGNGFGKETFGWEREPRGFGSGVQTQVALFREFLLRANRYRALCLNGGEASVEPEARLILLEDIPNQFYREPSSLHDVLRKFSICGRCPLVLVASDCSGSEYSLRTLLPRGIQEDLGVHVISFNPVSPTSLLKVLMRVASAETAQVRGRPCVLNQTVLQDLCASSAGDIRGAINALQFAWQCASIRTQDTSDSTSSVFPRKLLRGGVGFGPGRRGRRGTESPTSPEESRTVFGGRDVSLFLFHALGKILHCKRENGPISESHALPTHLTHQQRNMLAVNPEDVVERSQMSPELFTLYLHQNYLGFLHDAEDVSAAAQHLSDADCLTADWAVRVEMRDYVAAVATRGLLHSHVGRARSGVAGVGFRPLHKPEWISVHRKYVEARLEAKQLFSSFCLPPLALHLELLPYLALLNTPLRNPGQIAFLQDVGRFMHIKLPHRQEVITIAEHDGGGIDPDNNPTDPTSALPAPSNQSAYRDLSASQPQPMDSHEGYEDEELFIEEFDSD